jgi:multidrug efflux pump
MIAGAVALLAVAAGIYFIARQRPEAAKPFPCLPVEIQPVAYKSPLVISVEASYSGADAQMVANNLAAPIEQQTNGVKDMMYMSSRSGSDGTYKLNVVFKDGVDVNIAQVLVQNRVSLALPLLPGAVLNEGVSVRKKSPDVLMFVNLWSPDGRYDDIYPSNYVSIQIKNELTRLPGVSDLVVYGRRESKSCVWLDPKK